MKTAYTKECTKIYDSYNIKDLHREIQKIMTERELKGYPVKRTINSYIRETKAHNRLYKLGLFKSHTKDVDLEENIKLWREIAYFILSR